MNASGEVLLSRREISNEDKAAIFRVFHESDLGKKGYLEKEDIKVAILTLFGYKPSKYEVEQLVGIGLRDNCKGLNLERFQSLMLAKLSLEDPDQECRQIFNTFDIDCKGFLTLADFKQGFLSVTPNLSESTIASCFQSIDKDGDGRVSFRDFDFCMKYSPGR